MRKFIQRLLGDPKIYVVSAFTADGRDSRVFGWFKRESDALVAVNNDHGSMNECRYAYLVVETVDEGIHGLGHSQKFFRWHEFRSWVPCEEPEWAEGCCNFSRIG